MIITLTGPNDYTRKQSLRQAISAFVDEHGDMALEQLDGDALSFERMQEALQSPPFLSAKKLVVLHQPGKQASFAESSESILSAVESTTDVIVYEPKLDKRSRYYKSLQTCTQLQVHEELDNRQLIRWMMEHVEKAGGKLSLSDAQYLVDRVGANQIQIDNELNKLLLYHPRITTETIRLLCEAAPLSTVFNLLSAAFEGRLKELSKLYNEQRALKTDPQAIIAMLSWQLHVLAVIKAAGAKTSEQIAKESRISPFVIRNSVALAKRLEYPHIKTMVSDLVRLDNQLKRTSVDADEALLLYLMQLAVPSK